MGVVYRYMLAMGGKINANSYQEATILSKRFEGYETYTRSTLARLSPRQLLDSSIIVLQRITASTKRLEKDCRLLL